MCETASDTQVRTCNILARQGTALRDVQKLNAGVLQFHSCHDAGIQSIMYVAARQCWSSHPQLQASTLALHSLLGIKKGKDKHAVRRHDRSALT